MKQTYNPWIHTTVYFVDNQFILREVTPLQKTLHGGPKMMWVVHKGRKRIVGKTVFLTMEHAIIVRLRHIEKFLRQHPANDYYWRYAGGRFTREAYVMHVTAVKVGPYYHRWLARMETVGV